MKRTISFMTGKGSVNHNSRKFHAKNTDPKRSYWNVEYCNQDIREVYHELFDEALERYNSKQTRKDRKIEDYYEKIRSGKQEKPFHEIILQIGDKDNMGATTKEGQMAARILDEYMKDFQRRNPTLRVFSAHLHMDEATPHLHIDFVPYTTGSKRGLDTRVSLKQALSALGFKGGTRMETELNQWVAAEKQQLASIMLDHGIEWEQKGTHEKHLSLLDFEKQERAKEVAALEEQNGEIDEVAFCEYFLQKVPLKCIHDTFFGFDGMMTDEDVEKEIYRMVKSVLTKGVSKKVKQLLEVLRLEAHSEEIPAQLDRIHVKNGTLFLDGRFKEEKEFSLNRLPVNYREEALEPVRWLKFLSELLEEEDIPTLQEYMGYCLIPSNKAQKLLIILGKGGEGKSRIGLVMRSILGVNMNVGSIQKVEHNRFARADLEHRLLMVDDDMKLEALKDTSYIKSIVTLEDKMDLERKSRQSVQGSLYVRFLCFGNGSLNALHDRSYGFYRRQMILTVKGIKPGRIDDPYLIEKLKREADGIFRWCLEGLQRLLKNDYRFTISKRAERNLHEAMESGNNVIPFMESTGYIRLEANTTATSRNLYQTYCRWCEDNAEKPMSARSFSGYLKENEQKYQIRYSTNIPSGNGKSARGFQGIHTQIRGDD